MPFPTIPLAAAEREHEEARRHPERETLELGFRETHLALWMTGYRRP